MSQRLVCVGLLFLALTPSVQGETPRRDRYGDPLPPGAIARLGTTRLRHFGRVFDVAFAPDGNVLVSVGEDNRVRLWEAKTGRQLRQLPGPGRVTYSPNGKLLASSGDDGGIRLWNVATGKTVGGPTPAFVHFWGFSPDSKSLAFTKVVNPTPSKAPSEETVTLWDIAAARVIRTWTIKASTYAATYSPDGRTLAIGTNEWVAGTGTEEGKGSPGYTIGILSLWDTATGKELWRSARRLDGILSLAFSPEGKTLVSTGEFFDRETNKRHGTLIFWDAATGKELRQLPGLVDRVEQVRFSPDGHYLAAICGQGPIILWDVKAGKMPRRVWEVPDNGWSVAFAPNSRRFAWCTQQAIRLIDLPPRKEYDPRGGHAGSWPIATRSIPFVAFAPDGKTVISAGDRVRIWNADTGVELRASTELLRDCSAAVISPDGKTLITGSRGRTTQWDLATLKAIRNYATPNDYVQAMALAPDGKTLATTMKHISVGTQRLEMMVRLWDVETGKEKPPISKGTYSPHLAFAPDGNRLAGLSMYQNAVIRIWDTKTGDVSLDVKSGTGSGPGQALLGFSPDGTLLASAGQDRTIRLWDAHSGKPVRVLSGHQEQVRTLVFSPDSKTLLSGGEDDMMRLWDVATGKTLHELAGHQAAVVAAAFSRDGQRIASTSEDTTILIWDVPGLAKRVRPPPPPLTEEELQCLWSDLSSQWYTIRQRTIRRLMTAPEVAIAFLKQRLKPELPHGNRLARLLEDLDNNSFAVREKASRELARMDKSVGPVLRRVLAENPSPEKRRRLQAVVNALPRPQRPFRGIAAEERRLLNVVLLLDRIGTAEALDLMQFLTRSSELTALLADPAVWQSEIREIKEVLARRANPSRKP